MKDSTLIQITNKVEAAVQSLANSLQTTADQVFDILVRQQLVNSISQILLMGIVGFILYQFHKNYDHIDENWGEIPQIFAFVLSAIFAIVLIVGICCINGIITGFVNPEYGAIKKIFDLINPS